MLYTIINIYDVLRTDDIYPQPGGNYIEVCTDPYKYLGK